MENNVTYNWIYTTTWDNYFPKGLTLNYVIKQK